MHHRSRDRVRRRLRSLCLLELLNVPLQAGIWFGAFGLPASPANLAGFFLFALLLVEGACYWAAKLRQLSSPGSPLSGARYFAVAERVNILLLAAGVGYAVWAVVADPSAATVPGLGFALFAVLEHVNYFRVQLMHDTAADLRRLFAHGFQQSHLARDLSAWRKRRETAAAQSGE